MPDTPGPTDWLKQNPSAPQWLRDLVALFVDLPPEPDIDAAKTLLAQHDYVVLKTKSYRAAQETLHNEIRELMARCTFLYGAARAAGASVDELAGGWATAGINCPGGEADHG